MAETHDDGASIAPAQMQKHLDKNVNLVVIGDVSDRAALSQNA
jgi:hypothetical protein